MKKRITVIICLLASMTLFASWMTTEQKYKEIEIKIERDKFVEGCISSIESIYKGTGIKIDVYYVKSKHIVIAYAGKKAIVLIKVPDNLKTKKL